mgnify:FL=1|tara:strand:- start:417 stop:803 length:387 start_codon:yes stop_codon:yes gene_type:complete
MTSKNLPQFQPGQSGNPSGRPKLGVALAEKVRKATKDGNAIVKLLVEIAEGGLEAKISDRLAAAEMLLSRGWGKAVTQMEVTADVQVQHSLSDFNTAELRELVAMRRKLVEEDDPLVIEGEGKVLEGD